MWSFDGKAGWIKTPRGLLGEYELVGSELDGARLEAQLAFPGQIKQSLDAWRGSANRSIGDKDYLTVQGSGPRYASVIPGVPQYEHNPIPGVTQAGTIQWLNPDAFVSVVDPSTGACTGGDSTKNCQFGNLGRNALRGPDFFWTDLYLTKWFQLTERVKLRIDGQFFNIFNHPNFGLPVLGYAGIPGKPSTQTGFGALSYATSPPTGLLGVGLGGDNSPRMIAFQARLEF